MKPEANKKHQKDNAKEEITFTKTKKEELFQKGLAKNKGEREDEGRRWERDKEEQEGEKEKT